MMHCFCFSIVKIIFRKTSSKLILVATLISIICFVVSLSLAGKTNVSSTSDEKDSINNLFIPIKRQIQHGNCKEQKNFVFIKCMKCATETLGTVFRRYGYIRNLTFVTPIQDKLYLGWPFQMTEYDYRPSKRPFNIIMEHAVYNKSIMKALMPEDTLYLTIIREPYSHFKSLFTYFNLKNIAKVSGEDPITEYLHNLGKYELIYKSSAASSLRYCIPNNFSITKNMLSHCMGMPLGFPSGRENITTDEIAVKKYIQQIHKEFILVMIMEYFQESLILLKRIMCWSFRDIIYWTANVAQYPTKLKEPSKENVEIYKKWSAIDYKLYDHFNKTFWQKIREQTPDFFNEVKHFSTVEENVLKFCASPESKKIMFNKTVWSEQFEVTAEDCKMMKGYLLKAIQKRHDVREDNPVAPTRKKDDPNTPLC